MLCAASALALASAARPASAQVTQVLGPEVRSVEFEGNVTFPEDSLARAIVTTETTCRTWVLSPFCWVGFDFAHHAERFGLRVLERLVEAVVHRRIAAMLADQLHQRLG